MTASTPPDALSLAVTGATGRVGGAVARLLADAGLAQRLVVRDVDRAPDLPGAVAVRAAYAEPDAARAALGGVRTLLMVSASESYDRVEQHRTFVDAALDAGVRHVVYLSFAGAAPDATFTLARDHHATEEHLRAGAAATGATWTFLRDNLYADFLPLLAGEDGVIRGPAGTGRVAAVAIADVARAAAAVLADVVADPGAHAGATYTLTGPQALSLDEVAAVLTATGRPTTFHDETVPEAFASRASYGAPDWQVEAWVSTYTAIASGELAGVTGDVERLTGRPATSLQDLVAPD